MEKQIACPIECGLLQKVCEKIVKIIRQGHRIS